jgi:hypothetical protein
MIPVHQIAKFKFSLSEENVAEEAIASDLDERVHKSMKKSVLGISNLGGAEFVRIQGKTTAMCAPKELVKHPFLICRESVKPEILMEAKQLPIFVVGVVKFSIPFIFEPDSYMLTVDFGEEIGEKRSVLPGSYDEVDWRGRKVACLINLRKECVHDLEAHVACYTDIKDKNLPYDLTNEEAPPGETLLVLTESRVA